MNLKFKQLLQLSLSHSNVCNNQAWKSVTLFWHVKARQKPVNNKNLNGNKKLQILDTDIKK